MNQRAALLGLASTTLITAALAAAPAHASTVAEDDVASEASSTVRHLAISDTLGWWKNQELPARECPPEHPFLVNHDYAPARNVPNGIEVVELKGSVWVTIEPYTLTAGGGMADTATGWTNRGENGLYNPLWEDNRFEIWMHCTNDWRAGYQR